MFGFVIPLILIGAGIICLVYSNRIGPAFCRLGKAIWRTGTFGLIDMQRFYPEEKAPKIFRIFGAALLLFSVPWIAIAVASVSGPGAFAAMRESEEYLEKRYGSAGNWELSTQPAPPAQADYLVNYRYGGREGTLRATWKHDRYEFTEER